MLGVNSFITTEILWKTVSPFLTKVQQSLNCFAWLPKIVQSLRIELNNLLPRYFALSGCASCAHTCSDMFVCTLLCPCGVLYAATLCREFCPSTTCKDAVYIRIELWGVTQIENWEGKQKQPHECWYMVKKVGTTSHIENGFTISYHIFALIWLLLLNFPNLSSYLIL